MRKKPVIKRCRKAFLLMALCILILISFRIYCHYLREEEEQLQHKIRERMFAKVIKYENELMETVEECADEKVSWLIVRNPKDGRGMSHKKLDDGRIKKTFREFRLLIISKYEDGSVNFTVYSPVVNYLWDDYRYGFYYSKDDKAINVLEGGEECENEFEKKFIGHYWYRTEKIADNWWYYECKTRFFRTPLFNFWESAGNRIMPSKSEIGMWIIKILAVICVVSVLCIKFLFQKQVRNFVKNAVSSKVIEKESELLGVILVLGKRDSRIHINRKNKGENVISYKELDDKRILRIFKDFKLMDIDSNEKEKGYVTFSVYPYVNLLWKGYSYGFYYSVDDEPVDIETGGKYNLQFGEDEMAHRWYRTEKIADNWWYYERTLRVKFGGD